MPKYTLGIDVGGSKVAAGLIDNRGSIREVIVQPTSQKDLLAQIESIIERFKGRFSAVGIGMPGIVLENGTVIKLPNIKSFARVALKSHLEKKYKTKTVVINDAKAFAYAESVMGAGRTKNTVVGITLGTGIGCGLVRNKKVLHSPNEIAGEVGHILVPGGLTLERKMQRYGLFKKASDAVPYLKTLLSLVANTWDPDVIVFTGGRVNLPGMDKVLKKCVKDVYGKELKTKVTISKIDHAVAVGAALLALKK